MASYHTDNTGDVQSRGRTLTMRFFAAALLLCAVLSLSGCFGLFESKPQPRPDLPQPTLWERANMAWDNRDYQRSEQYYQQLAYDSSFPYERRRTAWERYTLSAIENGRFEAALQAIPQWKNMLSDGESNTVWQDTYMRVIKGVRSPAERENLYQALAGDTGRPFRLRAMAGGALAAEYWRGGDIQRTLALLLNLGQEASLAGRSAEADLEAGVFNEISDVRMGYIEAMEMLIQPGERNNFPGTIIQLEKARRLAESKTNWGKAWDMLQRLKPHLANAKLVDQILSEQGPTDLPPGLALLLPISGPYGEIGLKVVKGAAIARDELTAGGKPFELQVINSEGVGWEEQVKSLPPNILVVGGPLRVDRFKSALANELTNSKVFFSFLPSLGDATEGAQAWRFFSSPNDQITALLGAATQRYSLNNIAVMYPDDNFGRRMTEMFNLEAPTYTVSIPAKVSYPVKENYTWGELAGQIARSGASAVFLPGDWKHAEMIVPYFLYHNAGDMLIMGPAHWAQTLSRKTFVDIPSFNKTIFPGAWWEENNSIAAYQLKQRLLSSGGRPDFWGALGYDFVRFASLLGQVPVDWTPGDVNGRIGEAQNMEWAMAPIKWDDNGKARQELFMFKPTKSGFTLLDGPAASPAPTTPTTPSGETTYQTQ